jgi:DNA-directed RNA polymerase specialized sigma24 family protein/CheY-like chemotaxis protein
MSVAELVGPHLPYLRRFSRALSGSQSSGDAYVEALLETVVVDPSTVTAPPDPRIALYGLLCGLWESISLNLAGAEPADQWEKAAQAKLASIEPRPRQAFLLTAVEGFTLREAAEILRTDEEGVADLLDEAGREIGAMMATDVLIIEDEPLIAMDIEDIVTRLGHRPIGVARTRSEAVKLATRERPGIILADIQLADGSSGIDAVNDLLAEFEAPVIFITAFPERLLTGSRPEPTFLITKPFAPEMVKAMISQALFFDSRSKRPVAARA